jgi:hypothetical protein
MTRSYTAWQERLPEAVEPEIEAIPQYVQSCETCGSLGQVEKRTDQLGHPGSKSTGGFYIHRGKCETCDGCGFVMKSDGSPAPISIRSQVFNQTQQGLKEPSE